MIRAIMTLAVAAFAAMANVVTGAPESMVQSVTRNDETITLRLTREDLRGSNFELLAQNASGGYDVITPVAERSYLGTVDEYPDAVSCGVLQDDGTFRGAVFFDRGVTWRTLGSSVVGTQAESYAPESFTSYSVPSAPSVSAGQAGVITYGFDLGIDAEYGYYSGPGGSSVAKAFELIEYNICVTRAQYMRDALLRPYLGRVIVRTDQTQDPYTAFGAGDYLSALRTHWNANHADSNSDLVAGVTPGKVGGGLAWVGVVGTSSGYSVNDSGSSGLFDVVFRHEMGHNWNCGHYVGGSPEGTGFMGGNGTGRMSGPEVYRILNHRNSKISAGGILDAEGTYSSVELPPYASLDVGTFVQRVDSSVSVSVLNNDHDANGQSLVLSSFDSVSARGGTVTRQGDDLVYTAQGAYLGADYFKYTITDSAGNTATGVVVIDVTIQYSDPQVVIANHSFEDGTTGGVPNGWSHTVAGSGIGVGAGGSDGSYFLYMGPGAELTQDLGYTLTEGELLTLTYDSDRNYDRNIQLLAKSGGSYTLMAESTEATGWGGWATGITLQYAVESQYAGQELVVRMISANWNQFDNFQITSIKGASRPSPFDTADGTSPQDLTWNAYAAATGYDVYVGTNEVAVQNATTASPEYQGQVTSASLADPILNPNTTYFWRVDSVTSSGTLAGDVWEFTTNEQALVPIANRSFEDGPATSGAPTGWTLTAAGAGLGVGAGGSHGSQFVYMGTGSELTQDLGYTLTAGEALTLTYDSSRSYVRSVQLLAKSGGSYQLMAETTEPIGWSSWGTIRLDYTVASQYAGQELALRVNSGNWNEFDNFKLVTVRPAGPVNQVPVASDATFAVAEDVVIGSTVGTVSASDPDAGDTLSYAITAGNAGGEFAINSSTGEITTAAPLDYETTTSYALTVTVTDDGTPSLSDAAAVTVNVTDVVEVTAPVIATGSASSITQTSADVAYSVTDDGGDAPAVTVYYGETDGGQVAGNWANSAAHGNQATGGYTASLSGLTAGTTYYFTVQASNSAGTVWGSSGSFTTEASNSPKLVRTTVSAVSSTSWTTVDLGQNYNSAVIVATPIYPDTATPPVVTRIQNVSGSTFDLKIDRADGLIGEVTVDVSVIAVEEGVYTQASDGVTMEAVKFTSTVTAGRTPGWIAESRSYLNSYSSPVVVGQVMSANDSNFSTFFCMGGDRLSHPSATVLNVGKQIAEDDVNTGRADEVLGYIVVESGSGSLDGVALVAGVGADSVKGVGDSPGYSYNLSGLASASAAAVSVAGMDGNNGGWAVLYGAGAINSSTLTMAVDEDQIRDGERRHGAEQIGYLVFE
ncbi:cadherin domain-containing protein [Sulfuriroseicoccus oceanibius]|uniref:Cadherin domain-containing protein n=1 Tax=Sulfuriroseicoccus oceanibius TaxID=2707525 RepID=A0A7T7F0Y4_9BACT|nr:cadherin domain-containing protein [Sulfuriroseicoccus oceanibius]QQL44668.1 cadherin domain-containing protein [Sulfuriroseicoccus oceanibius]